VATSPESVTIEAELFIRYPSGQETKLGDLQIKQHVKYAFTFEPTSDDGPVTVTESLARISKETGQ
jgi:hypothetical protein